MDDQIEQRPQLLLDRLEHTLVQITRLVAFRNVQQSAELLDRDFPDAGLSILLQTPIRLLRVAGLQSRELGQFEARELRREVVEQERKTRVDRDQQFRGLPIGLEAGKQRELHRPAVILEPEPTSEQPVVDLNDSCRQLLVGEVLLDVSQPAEFLESESDLIDFLISHPCRDGHQQIQVKRSELAQRLSVELVRIFHDLVGHNHTLS